MTALTTSHTTSDPAPWAPAHVEADGLVLALPAERPPRVGTTRVVLESELNPFERLGDDERKRLLVRVLCGLVAYDADEPAVSDRLGRLISDRLAAAVGRDQRDLARRRLGSGTHPRRRLRWLDAGQTARANGHDCDSAGRLGPGRELLVLGAGHEQAQHPHDDALLVRRANWAKSVS